MKRVAKYGSSVQMTPREIEEWYSVLKEEHATYLANYGVKMPTRHTGKALWLVFLRKHLGEEVHKDTISSFVSSVLPTAGKDQQVRHLAADGWYILNRGDKVPGQNEVVPAGYHVLLSTESPKPSFLYKSLKRAGRIAAKDFGQLKATYGFRCATCGSQEGKPHLLEPDKRTELHQGHMNPHKMLDLSNSIPQCQVCNAVYQDDFVFDEKGRVVAIASLKPIVRAEKEILNQVKELLSTFTL